MRMSRGNNRCWCTIVIGITAQVTVWASPGRGSGQGKKERDTQLGRSGSETWCGVVLAVMEYRVKVAVMRSEEQRRGGRLNDEHRCRPTTVGGITAWAILRAGRGSGQGRRGRGTQLGWIGGETFPATWVGVALARMGAGVCQTAVASPTAAIVVTITTATGDGRDSQRTAVATTEG